MPALDVVEKHWREQWRTAKKSADKLGGGGALIIVGNRKQDKFFSNGRSMSALFTKTHEVAFFCVGLDFAKVSGDPNFFPSKF